MFVLASSNCVYSVSSTRLLLAIGEDLRSDLRVSWDTYTYITHRGTSMYQAIKQIGSEKQMKSSPRNRKYPVHNTIALVSQSSCHKR